MNNLRKSICAQDPLEQLSAVTWLSEGQHSQNLQRLGIPHGFGGKGEQPSQTIFPKQVHGIRIVDVSKMSPPPQGSIPEDGDGVFSVTKNAKIAIRTADCLPLLVGVNAPSSFVGAVHAGWRGLTAGIVSEMLRLFRVHGAELAATYVAIGPAIGPGSFEVGPEVIAAAADNGNDKGLGLTREQHLAVCTKGRGDRWHFDLQAAAVFTLINHGVPPANIDVLRICTKLTPTLNSYRREGKGVGSNYSWIAAR